MSKLRCSINSEPDQNFQPSSSIGKHILDIQTSIKAVIKLLVYHIAKVGDQQETTSRDAPLTSTPQKVPLPKSTHTSSYRQVTSIITYGQSEYRFAGWSVYFLVNNSLRFLSLLLLVLRIFLSLFLSKFERFLV